MRSPQAAIPSHAVEIGLSAAIVSVAGEEPQVLVIRRKGNRDALPFGPFDPLHHRTLESGLRSWVREQTYLGFDYAEQLYTFGDRGRHLIGEGESSRVVSVGYLALTRAIEPLQAPDTDWGGWYNYFPWEDWRAGRPPVIQQAITPALTAFSRAGSSRAQVEQRQTRARLCFGLDGLVWNEERTLERYELLYEAGLVAEAVYDGRVPKARSSEAAAGTPMLFDHRRILATAISRLRGKMKYRPVVFDLMPPAFTLLALQRTVEAISGIRLHKQNFRRLVEEQGLVERTGKLSPSGRGRPAELFRFRREVLNERHAPGLRLGTRRTGF